MSGKYNLDLRSLLVEELHGRLAQLSPDAPLAERKRALHTVRGSVGLAGEKTLYDTLTRLERQVAKRPEALDDAWQLVAEAVEAMREDRPVPSTVWPEPPPGLVATSREGAAVDFMAAMRDRLDRIDAALSQPEPSYDAALGVHREVHAMKGAALALGDEVTAWFCHGLEEQLQSIRSAEPGSDGADEQVRHTLDIMARWRALLGEVISSPEQALESLRLNAMANKPSSRPPADSPLPLPPKRPTIDAPGESEAAQAGEAMVRVSAKRLDELFERVRLVGQAKSTVAAAAYDAERGADQARTLHFELTEALRLIGPPKPWGAPAAAIRHVERSAEMLERMAGRMDQRATALKTVTDRVRRETAAAQRELARMRTTRAGELFDRVTASVTAHARREGREVRIQTSGGDVPIDRRLSDALFDPIVQLARNAVAHGLESATDRISAGKPAVGTLSFDAELRGGGLMLRIADDGAGVDLPDVRRRAVLTSMVTKEMADALDDEALLTLLFVPGFTTRESADLLAGRGVGLDLTLAAIRRVGGTIRLTSRRGQGMSALLRVPVESGLVRVLWVRSTSMWYAVPIQHVRRIHLEMDAGEPRAIPLRECLLAAQRRPEPEAMREMRPRRFCVELDRVDLPMGAPPCRVGVDEIGIVEELAVRGVSPLVTTAGPYAGAIVRGDDVRLCLDPHGLADLVSVLRAQMAPAAPAL